MTVEEAIKRIIDIFKYRDLTTCDADDYALVMAASALMRQRAKRPIRTAARKHGEGDHYECPVCGGYLGLVDDCADEYDCVLRYCPTCGQKLDWEVNYDE